MGAVEKKIIFMGESGECSEASAKSCDEQRTHLRRQADASVDETEENADNEASYNIDRECSTRELPGGVVSDGFAQQESASASERAPDHHIYQIYPHKSAI